MISYDVLLYDYNDACGKAQGIIENAQELDMSEQKIVTIPSYYGLEVGLDLESLAQEKNLSIDTIIDLHVKQDYFVYAIGFAPGFAYLGETNEALATSRLSSPRKAVPKGSIGYCRSTECSLSYASQDEDNEQHQLQC